MWGLPVLLPKIGTVQEGSAALKAGLMKADTITAIDGKQINRWTDMAELINNSGGKVLQLTIERGGNVQIVSITPTMFPVKNIFGEPVSSYKIGISPSLETRIERLNPFSAFIEGVKQTWVVSKLTLLSVVKMFQGVISPKTLGGPIMIAQLAGAQVKEGIIPFLLFMAMLSINLAVLNLLPIPILDGGHLFFYLIEAVTGKEISLKWRERAQQLGFALLIILMLFVFAMDLDRLNIKFLQDIGKKFF
jgi:regulator of sigma E protease